MKISIVILAFISAVSTYAQPDFSGSWKLNTDKSQFNKMDPAIAPVKLIVEQSEGTITYQRNERSKEVLKIDSTASIEVTNADNTTKVSMKPTVDKTGLIETREYVYPDGTEGLYIVKKTRTWAISTDKKTLTIRDQLEASNGSKNEMVLIYERQ